MPEPPIMNRVSLAFIEGPLLEEIGQFIGRVVPVGRGVDAIGKVLPIPALQALLKRTKELTEEQKKQDGQRVVKVHDVIQIIEEELRGIVGTINELGDALGKFLPPIGSDAVSPIDRIEERIREAALFNKNPRVNGKWEPIGKIPGSGLPGGEAEFRFPIGLKIRKGKLHGLSPPRGIHLPA